MDIVQPKEPLLQWKILGLLLLRMQVLFPICHTNIAQPRGLNNRRIHLRDRPFGKYAYRKVVFGCKYSHRTYSCPFLCFGQARIEMRLWTDEDSNKGAE